MKKKKRAAEALEPRPETRERSRSTSRLLPTVGWLPAILLLSLLPHSAAADPAPSTAPRDTASAWTASAWTASAWTGPGTAPEPTAVQSKSNARKRGTRVRLDSKVRRELTKLSADWWKARPATRFEEWDDAVRAELLERAAQLGPVPAGTREQAIDLFFEGFAKNGRDLRARGGKIRFDTPFGEAWAYLDRVGKDKGLVIGLHGGGEGAGSADEPRGTWQVDGTIGVYPQGIRLVHDTWNTVHGERFVLTLIDYAKAALGVDPDRVYVAGFSMGGTGSWFFAGRHSDLFAAAFPFAGVFMASPKSQLAEKSEVVAVQHGLIPNVRNLPLYYTIGLEDRNTMPGTYLFVKDRLDELKAEDQNGYEVHFRAIEKLAHAYPPGEPGGAKAFAKQTLRQPYPDTIVWEYVTEPFPLAGSESPLPRIQKHEFYWIEDARPVDHQTIRATRSGSTFTVEAANRSAGLEGISILLNDDMVASGEEVVVQSGGKDVWRGIPESSFATLLDTLDRRLDRKLAFDQRIRLSRR